MLHGAISPINGIGPDDLKIKELFLRLKNEMVDEVILATNLHVEGEATAMYINNLLVYQFYEPLHIRITIYLIPVT